jgi:hypothetical protein
MDVLVDYLMPFLALLIGGTALLIISLSWKLWQLDRTFRDRTSCRCPDDGRSKGEDLAARRRRCTVDD